MCMLWWKWVNVFLYRGRSLVTDLPMNNWLYRHGERNFHTERTFFFYFLRHCLHTVNLFVCVCSCDMAVCVASTQCAALSWLDLPHLENSHSHHCNRLWHQSSSRPRQCPEIISIPEKENKPSKVYHKVQLTGCPIDSALTPAGLNGPGERLRRGRRRFPEKDITKWKERKTFRAMEIQPLRTIIPY